MGAIHLSSYLGFCAVTVAAFVFINAEQPFVLSDVYHKVKGSGSIVSVLALADELTNILFAPLWGALSDKIGTRYVAVSGLALLAIGTFLYPLADSIYPTLVLIRIIFASGASACVSMMTAMLAEYSITTLSLERDSVETAASIGFGAVPLLAQENGPEWEVGQQSPQKTGKVAGLVGFASGCGAVLAVSLLLPLPTILGYEDHPATAVTAAFRYVAIGLLVLGVVLLLTLYQNQAKGLIAWVRGRDFSIFEEAALNVSTTQNTGYWELLAAGFGAARNDRALQLAYVGGVVARASSVAITLFIPLLANDWYYKTGKCIEGKGCRDGYVLAAILTGCANLASLLGAPILGFVVDRSSVAKVLCGSSVLGALTMLAWVLMPSPASALGVIFSVMMGLASTGVMTESMVLCTKKRRDFSGSVAGVYSLCGGIGILLLTQIGGPIADVWVKAPFVVLGVLYAILAFISL